ncbi:hypothetical protein DFH09DRAFT_1123949 [Mycena vulgaris]|nr:hypothetical protein DFH09DRAFT_1123949 [Mycena vulgaris]
MNAPSWGMERRAVPALCSWTGIVEASAGVGMAGGIRVVGLLACAPVYSAPGTVVVNAAWLSAWYIAILQGQGTRIRNT